VSIYSNTETSLAMSTFAAWCRVVTSRDYSALTGSTCTAIHARQCYCSVFTTLRCQCHSAAL